ncbi:hypothetical protein E4P41_14785 [Geodermatophilus sp. DF01-2]|uniref:hypothetical protein n=1 Tax=Geodermatophilus sp. DF01-2 TaxID=2559610 RepID=UPI0010740F1E|nr:hypothetical protein [Geodermatophilus sp. DF01_2]TFV57272.1 hypothetical protein E4P41_14785 [Geodermatophilus sp. DF01_2]
MGQTSCLGSQHDASAYGDIVITPTDSRRAGDACDAPGTADPQDYSEGIRVRDTSDESQPRLLASVATDCGSHTNTLVPAPANDRMLVYVSSYSPNDALADCRTPHDKIGVVAVPDADPAPAPVIAEPVLFPDGGSPAGAPGRARRSRPAGLGQAGRDDHLREQLCVNHPGVRGSSMVCREHTARREGTA